MNQLSFWVGAAIASLVFSILACWARRTGGFDRLALFTGLVVSVLAVVGLIEWSNQSPRETPLLTYLLLATLPPSLAAGTVQLLASRLASDRAQVLSASVVGLVLVPVALLTAFFP